VPIGKGQLEEPFVAEPVHLVLSGRVIRFNDPELFGSGNECTNDDGPRSAGLDFVNTKKSKGIGMISEDNEVNV
jgi:hypothetical protein